MKFWKTLFWINIVVMVIAGFMDLSAGERLPSPNVFQVVSSLVALYELTLNEKRNNGGN